MEAVVVAVDKSRLRYLNIVDQLCGYLGYNQAAQVIARIKDGEGITDHEKQVLEEAVAAVEEQLNIPLDIDRLII